MCKNRSCLMGNPSEIIPSKTQTCIRFVLERALINYSLKSQSVASSTSMYAKHLQSLLQGEKTKRKPPNHSKHVEIITQAPLKFATQTKHMSSINCLSHCLRWTEVDLTCSAMALAALLPCFQARGWWRLKATEWVAEDWSSALILKVFSAWFRPFPSRSLTRYLLEIIVSISSKSDRWVIFWSSSSPAKRSKHQTFDDELSFRANAPAAFCRTTG